MSGQLHTHAWHRITLVLYSIITLALSVTCTQGISHDHDTLYLLSKFKEAAFGGEYDVQTRSNPSPFLGLLGTLGDVLRFPAAFKSETIAVDNQEWTTTTAQKLQQAARNGPVNAVAAAAARYGTWPTAAHQAAWLDTMQAHATALLNMNELVLRRRFELQQADATIKTQQHHGTLENVPKQGAALSYPHTRRLVIAALLRQWLVHSSDSHLRGAFSAEAGLRKASRRKVLLADGSTPVPYLNPMHAAQAGSEEQVQQQGQPTTPQTEASVHLLLQEQPALRVLAEAAGAAPARDASSRLLHSDRVAMNETDTRHSTGAAWDASNNQAVFALLRTLYSIHVSGLAARGVMEFVHVSKAGGTSTCMAAAGNGCRSRNMTPARTCLLIELDDKPRWVSGAAHLRAYREAVTYMQAQNATTGRAHTRSASRIVAAAALNSSLLSAAGPSRHIASGTSGTTTGHPNVGSALANGEVGSHMQRKQVPRPAVSENSSQQSLSSKNRRGLSIGTARSLMRRKPDAAAEHTAEHTGAPQPRQQAAAAGQTATYGAGQHPDEDEEGPRANMQEDLLLPPGVPQGMHSTKQRSEGLRAPRAVKLATCEGRVEQLALKGYNYYANEYTALSRPTHASAEAGSSHTGSGDADGGASSDGAVLTCSKDIAKMFVVRDPARRMVSHVQHILRMYCRQFKNALPTAERMLSGRDAAFWHELAPAAVDNYYVRSLLGEAVFARPVGQLHQDHLAAAKVVLLQLDMIHVLESGPATTSSAFHYGLGWRHTLLHQANMRKHDTVHADVLKVADAWMPSQQVLDQLLHNGTSLDGELYSFARTVAAVDAVLWAAMARMQLPPYAHFAAEPAPEASTSSVQSARAKRTDAASQAVPHVEEEHQKEDGEVRTMNEAPYGFSSFTSSLGARQGGALPPPCGHIGLAARQELWGALPPPAHEHTAEQGHRRA